VSFVTSATTETHVGAKQHLERINAFLWEAQNLDELGAALMEDASAMGGGHISRGGWVWSEVIWNMKDTGNIDLWEEIKVECQYMRLNLFVQDTYMYKIADLILGDMLDFQLLQALNGPYDAAVEANEVLQGNPSAEMIYWALRPNWTGGLDELVAACLDTLKSDVSATEVD
jgi:hypothetical protein